jgi:hypothetical protein
MSEGNVLYYGDNLDVLRRHGRDECVDLVYLGLAWVAAARVPPGRSWV